MHFAGLDPGSQQLCGLPARCPDTHVTVVPEMAGVFFPPRLAPGHQRHPNTGFAPVSKYWGCKLTFAKFSQFPEKAPTRAFSLLKTAY